MKLIYTLLMLFAPLFSLSLQEPVLQYLSGGFVNDIVLHQEKLYAATTTSGVDVFEVKTAKKLQRIEVPKIEDYLGVSIDSKVYSVDILKDKMAILSQANDGFRRVHLYEDEKLQLIISKEKELYISKVKFLDENRLILALLGNELISYSLQSHQINWRIQVSAAKFSDFALNEKRSEIAVADESGEIKIFDAQNGALIDTLAGENLDEVFQIDYKNKKIATAGKDRRVAVYDLKNMSAYYKTSHFFIYCVGLSPSGKVAGYSSDENSNITLFDTDTKENLFRLAGNESKLSKILFLNENEIFVSSFSKEINLFRLK